MAAVVGAVELINNGNYSSNVEEERGALVNFVVWRQTSNMRRRATKTSQEDI